MLEQESKRNNTTTDTDGSSSWIAIAAGGGSSSCSTSSGDANMVSLTIPLFRPLNECSSANGSSDETPNESWVGFKVMA